MYGGHLGPSLGHVDRQHGLDCREFVAREVSDQLLGATPCGQDLKTHPGPLLGAQGWHTGGERAQVSVDVRFMDLKLDGPLWPQVLLCLGLDKVIAPLALLTAALGHWAPSVLGN